MHMQAALPDICWCRYCGPAARTAAGSDTAAAATTVSRPAPRDRDAGSPERAPAEALIAEASSATPDAGTGATAWPSLSPLAAACVFLLHRRVAAIVRHVASCQCHHRWPDGGAFASAIAADAEPSVAGAARDSEAHGDAPALLSTCELWAFSWTPPSETSALQEVSKKKVTRTWRADGIPSRRSAAADSGGAPQ